MKKQLFLMLALGCAFSAVRADDDEDDGYVSDFGTDLEGYVEPSRAEQTKDDVQRRLANQRNAAVVAAQDVAEKAVDKQLDLMEEQLEKWLEEKLPAIIEAAIAKIGSGVSYGANSLYEGAKSRVSRGWNWLTGNSSKTEAIAPQRRPVEMQMPEEEQRFYDKVPTESLLEYDDMD